MKKWIFFGLGNPGDQFEGTRHNLGWAVLRHWAERATAQELAKVDVLEPVTAMNDSGQALAAFLRNKEVGLDRVVILHDDLELSLGDVRLVDGGSAKGHNGVRSVQAELGSQDFKRLRLGIGRPEGEMTVHDFVLGKFGQAEQELLARVYADASQLLSVLAEDD